MNDDKRQKRSHWLATSAIALLGLVPHAAIAETITVCLDGACDFASVDEAILASSAGDRIEVGPGSYPLTMSHLDMDERANEIVGTLGPNGPLTELRPTAQWRWWANELQMSGLAIRGDVGGVATHGLYLSGSDESTLTMRDCHLTGLRRSFWDGGAIVLERCLVDSCVENNPNGDCCSDFFRASRSVVCNDSVMKRCQFSDGNHYLIGLYDDYGVSGSDFEIRRSHFEDNVAGSIGLLRLWSPSSNGIISECTFSGNRANPTDPLLNDVCIASCKSFLMESCVFEGHREDCSVVDIPRQSTSIGIWGGEQIDLQDCDFEGYPHAIALNFQESLGPIGSLRVSSCRFVDNHPHPTCWSPDAMNCPVGGAFQGAYFDPFDSRNPGGAFSAERVTFSNCHFCGNGETQLSGAWTDGGGNCISRDCVDTDGDGAADDCSSGEESMEVHVPGDVSDLNAALIQAVRGQTIVLAPGDHELVGLTTLQAADLVIRAGMAITDLPGSATRIILVEDGDVGIRVLSSPGQGVRFEGIDIVLPGSGGFEIQCSGSSQPVMTEGSIIAEVSTLSFRSCRILMNNASTGIGAFNGSLQFDDCQLINTGSTADSPLVDVRGGDLSITGSVFDSIRLLVDDAVLDVSRSRFESVASPKGAIEASYTDVRIDRCDFVDGSATGNGAGATYLRSCTTQISECWFQDNESEASSGGAIFARGGGSLSLASNAFCRNSPDDIFSTFPWDDLGGNAFEVDGCGRMAGDLDGDGCVTGADLGLLFLEWGIDSGSPADLDRDGTVGGGDLGLLFTSWSQCF